MRCPVGRAAREEDGASLVMALEGGAWPQRFHLLLIGAIAVMMVGCAGCALFRSQEESAVIIPDRDLPPGWYMLRSSEMPPIDLMPWWHKNPQTLRDGEIEQMNLLGQEQMEATCARVAIYGAGEDDRVVVGALTYQTSDAAMVEFKALLRTFTPEDGLIGFLKQRDDVIIMMAMPSAFPGREGFVRYFRAIAVGP